MKASIVGIKQETPDVKSFKLKPESPINFKAGQYLNITLAIPEDNIRVFSIAASPTEETLMIATKFREPLSVFKQNLGKMKVGDTAEIRAPFGKFVIPEDYSTPIVLMSGGIGITPFRSIIKFATDKKLPLKITLLYSNRTSADIAFKDDLEECARLNPNFKLVNTITEDPSWAGAKGKIDENFIRSNVNDLTSIFFVCGPPGMVSALVEILKKMQIPDDRIRIENFAGY